VENNLNLLNRPSIKELSTEQRILFVKQVRSWADLNTDALLDSNCKLFSIPSIEGFIGYRIEKKCAVVFGDPVCALADQSKFVEAFQHYCQEHRLNIVYVIVSKNFAFSPLHRSRQVAIHFGNKLILNPQDNPLKKTGPKAVLLRKKVKHALKAGVVVQEYLNEDPLLEKNMEEVGQSWLQSRYGPQIFIAHLNFFGDRVGKRWFYAKQNERLIGFLILNEIQEGTGWLLNNLILTPDASSGTSELLIATVLETLKEENCNSIIIGPVVGTHINQISGLGAFSSWFVQTAFRAIIKMFHLDGQRVYWEKFQPKEEPSYLLFDKVNFRTIKGLLCAMNAKITKKRGR
jgi:lysylphosphatidylglycerol synthetase-like protein (DUF2156 family)